MGTITRKRIKGNNYYYYVESRRVNGKPRIVNQVYLGTAEKLLKDTQGGQMPKEVKHQYFGDVAALYGVSQKLGIIEAISLQGHPSQPSHAPYPTPVGQLFVGHHGASSSLLLQERSLVIERQIRAAPDRVNLAAQGPLGDIDGHVGVELVAVGQHHRTVSQIGIGDHNKKVKAMTKSL